MYFKTKLRYYTTILGLANGNAADRNKLKDISPNMPQQYYMELMGKKRDKPHIFKMQESWNTKKVGT